MKALNLIILAFCLLFSSYATAQNFSLKKYQQHPNYLEVVDQFIQDYNYKSSEPTQLRLAHTPEGWSVKVYDYVEKKVVTNEVFWRNGNYKKLNKIEEKKDSESNKKLETELKGYQLIKDHERHPFFGYDNWMDDVIEYFEPLVKSLNEKQVYGLARAYSAKGSNYSTNQYSFRKTAEIEFIQGGNCLNKEQKVELIRLNRKAVQYFKLTESLNPQKCVIVGRINTKVSNEYVDLYYKLWPLANVLEATQKLPLGLYTPNMISSAKNYLNSCPPNAILFTNGDNDTYPLLYVQAVYGIRQDVSVINYSMLGIEMFIDAVKRGIGNNKVLLELPYEFYKKTGYLLFNHENTGSLNIANLEIDGQYLDKDKIALERMGKTTIADFKSSRYIARSTIAALDIIKNNQQRPIAFSQKHIAKSLGLDSNQVFNGYTFNFIPQKNVEVNIKAINNFLEHSLTLKGFSDSTNFVYCTETESYQNSLSFGTMNQNILTVLYFAKISIENKDEIKRLWTNYIAIRASTYPPLLQQFNEVYLKVEEKLKNLD